MINNLTLINIYQAPPRILVVNTLQSLNPNDHQRSMPAIAGRSEVEQIDSVSCISERHYAVSL